MTTLANAVRNGYSQAAEALRSLQTPAVGLTARTDNGALTNPSSGSKVVDFFAAAGSVRGNPGNAVNLFKVAFNENPKLASQALLWLRDFRGSGAGEREAFRQVLLAMEVHSQFEPYMERIIPYIPEIGRWDDMLIFTTKANKDLAFNCIKEALWADNAICAKWMPRKGKLVPELRAFLGLSPKTYRKLLVSLTKVVETQMCAKNWEGINFSHVPSVASSRYQKAFGRNAQVAYSAYIAEISKPVEDRKDPKVKINASTVYPHEVIRNLSNGNAAVAETQWAALPNYMSDRHINILPIMDSSASMDAMYPGTGVRFIDVGVALGLYTSERNVGAMKDLTFTFESKARAINLSGNLSQRRTQILAGRIVDNTNFQSAFELLLNIATSNAVPIAEMPEVILILSDMQFDQAQGKHNSHAFVNGKFVETSTEISNFQAITNKYAQAGYPLPRIVFWNLNARADAKNPVTFREDGTALVSGFSPSILKSILSMSLETFTPENVMLETIDSPRYRIFEGL